jgi:hypothetical protein
MRRHIARSQRAEQRMPTFIAHLSNKACNNCPSRRLSGRAPRPRRSECESSLRRRSRDVGSDSRVGGATGWFWARPDASRSVDVLFIDEAAHMSASNWARKAGCADGPTDTPHRRTLRNSPPSAFQASCESASIGCGSQGIGARSSLSGPWVMRGQEVPAMCARCAWPRAACRL